MGKGNQFGVKDNKWHADDTDLANLCYLHAIYRLLRLYLCDCNFRVQIYVLNGV